MGVDIWTARFLASEAERGVDFTRTLTLGRQSLCINSSEYALMFPNQPLPEYGLAGLFSDKFLSSLGATTIDAIDASDYEGANIIYDLNLPMQVKPENRWSCVFDGGALEHIFQLPTAIKNCMEATKVGGHFITVCPWTGLAGHGFYQFSPELLYRILSPANGFEVERMLFRYNGKWRTILDPLTTGRRFEYNSKEATLIFASARRTREVEIFSNAPQQSDYVAMWSSVHQSKTHSKPFLVSRAVDALLPRLARRVRRWREERRILKNCSTPTNL